MKSSQQIKTNAETQRIALRPGQRIMKDMEEWSKAMKTIAFEEYKQSVDSHCLKHLGTSWADLCGDEEPLKSAFDDGESPSSFVHGWAKRYDLIWSQ